MYTHACIPLLEEEGGEGKTTQLSTLPELKEDVQDSEERRRWG